MLFLSLFGSGPNIRRILPVVWYVSHLDRSHCWMTVLLRKLLLDEAQSDTEKNHAELRRKSPDRKRKISKKGMGKENEEAALLQPLYFVACLSDLISVTGCLRFEPIQLFYLLFSLASICWAFSRCFCNVGSVLPAHCFTSGSLAFCDWSVNS